MGALGCRCGLAPLLHPVLPIALYIDRPAGVREAVGGTANCLCSLVRAGSRSHTPGASDDTRVTRQRFASGFAGHLSERRSAAVSRYEREAGEGLSRVATVEGEA